ncbi:MAG: hypothetical protein IJC49_03780 [Clostridia bacterium]|nr:hypothetical protein [Clostridia bacterium]
MKKTLSLILTLAMLLCGVVAFSSTNASADYETYEIGEMTLSHINPGLFPTDSSNMLAVFGPGNSLNGRYWTKIYARSDGAGNFVVEEKIGCHRAYNKTVENGCIALMIMYAPLSANSVTNKFAIENWKVWDRIKVGDVLKISGVNFLKKTIDTTGTWTQADFVSNAKVKVTARRDKNALTSPYTDKTIVAMGDSITVGGGWTYDLSDALRTDVINSGFGGDTAHASLAARYDTHVAAYNPDIVIVSFGINDAVSSLIKNDLPAGLAQYEKALRDIYARNTAIGAKTVFQSANNIKIATFDGPAYDAYGGLQGWIDTVIGTMKKVAEEYDCLFIDLYSMWKEKGLAPTNLVDSTHPTEVGYDANLELIIPAFKDNVNLLCDYEGEFDWDATSAPDDTGSSTPDIGIVEGKGDVNNDGVIDNLDAVMILKYDAGLINDISDIADANGDGYIDNLDATLILKYDAGLIG